MDSKALSASLAYLNSLKRAAEATEGPDVNLGSEAANAGPSFKELLQDAGQTVVDNTAKAESMQLHAVAKQAELVDVISAVTNAEMALESVVAVRDRVVQAYQDILRMPI